LPLQSSLMNTYPPSQPPMPQKKSSKKWWFLGCGGCLGIILLGFLVIGGIFYTAMTAIKKTDAYAEAAQRAKNSPALQEAIGTPMEEQFWSTGAVAINNGASTADFIIPINGPKGTAVVTVKAAKAAGATNWEYSVLEAIIATGPKKDTTIDLK
ncbi:MAG TPA: cytochrome c oxidase assembly factor Coa1 family protein, partial [Candidatus Saccharimonadia bacterium]|nr:cytochrome c oxidase assembly factor Coa1 family protein [Candidatus Saccharimonadia bacterium]